jgi:hypothetical protein
VVLTNEKGVATVTKTNNFITPQNISAQIGHHQVILEEHTGGDGIHIN